MIFVNENKADSIKRQPQNNKELINTYKKVSNTLIDAFMDFSINKNLNVDEIQGANMFLEYLLNYK